MEQGQRHYTATGETIPGESGWYVDDETGIRHYIECLEDENIARRTLVILQIYRRSGLRPLDTHLVRVNGKFGIAAPEQFSLPSPGWGEDPKKSRGINPKDYLADCDTPLERVTPHTQDRIPPPAQLVDFIYEVSETDIDELVRMYGIADLENQQMAEQLIQRRRDIIKRFGLEDIDVAGRARRLNEAAERLRKRRESRPPRPHSETSAGESQPKSYELFIRTALAADGDKIKNQSIDIIEQPENRQIISFRLTKKHWQELLSVWRYEGERSEIVFADRYNQNNKVYIAQSVDFTHGNARLKLSLGGNNQISEGMVHIEVDHADDPRSMIDVEYLLRQVLDIPNGVDSPKEADVNSYKEARYRWVHKLDPETTEHHGRPITECAETLTQAEVYPEYHTFIEPSRAERLVGKSPFLLYHSVGEPTRIPTIIESGIACTKERFERGAHIQGMSSPEDIVSGGADSVFLRMETLGRTESERAANTFRLNNSLGGLVLLFDPFLINRTDHYCYPSDEYGSKKPGIYARRITVEALHTKISEDPNGMYSSNELMFQRGISSEAMHAAITDDHTMKYTVEQILLATGQDMIGGVPVYDFVQHCPTTESAYRLLYPESVTTDSLIRELVAEIFNQDDHLSAMELIINHVTDRNEARQLFCQVLETYMYYLNEGEKNPDPIVDTYIEVLLQDTSGNEREAIRRYRSLLREYSMESFQLFSNNLNTTNTKRRLRILQRQAPDILADALINHGDQIRRLMVYDPSNVLHECFNTALDHLVSIDADEQALRLISTSIIISPLPASIYHSLRVLSRKPELTHSLKRFFHSVETSRNKKDLLLEILLRDKNYTLADELTSHQSYIYPYNENVRVDVTAIRAILEEGPPKSDQAATLSKLNQATIGTMLSTLLQRGVPAASKDIMRSLIVYVNLSEYANLFPLVISGVIELDVYLEYAGHMKNVYSLYTEILHNRNGYEKLLWDKQSRDRLVVFLRKVPVEASHHLLELQSLSLSIALQQNDPDSLALFREYVDTQGIPDTYTMKKWIKGISKVITPTEYQQLPSEIQQAWPIDTFRTLIDRFCSEEFYPQVEELIADLTDTLRKKYAVCQYVRSLASAGHVSKAHFYAQSIKNTHIKDACLGEISVGMTTSDPNRVRNMLRYIRNPHTRTTYLYEVAKGHLRAGDRDLATRLIGQATHTSIHPVRISTDESIADK